MNEDGLPADTDAVEDRRESWDENKTTRDRVYEVAIQLYDPTSVAAVGERADCSADAARNHLEWFHEVGILERIGDRPATYRRNESYFEWKRTNELRERFDAEERRERIERLAAADAEYRERYDADDPTDVDALEEMPHEELHEIWDDLNEWRTVRRELRLLERVRRDQTALDELAA